MTDTRTPMPDGKFLSCGEGIKNRFTNYLHVHAVMEEEYGTPSLVRVAEQEDIENYCPKFKKI